MHHSGEFIYIPRKVYVEGEVDYFDLCEVNMLSIVVIDKMVKALGHSSSYIKYYWLFPGANLDNGLKPLENEGNVLEMVLNIPINRHVSIYLEHRTKQDLLLEEKKLKKGMKTMVKQRSSGVVIRDIDEGNNVRDIVPRDYNKESDDGIDDEEEDDDGSSGYHDNDDGDTDTSMELKFAINQVVSSNAAFPCYTTPAMVGGTKGKGLKTASTKTAIYMTSFNQQ
ncbi:hypothetical protein SLE2022_056000 [Rubroshorea leprosula]